MSVSPIETLDILGLKLQGQSLTLETRYTFNSAGLNNYYVLGNLVFFYFDINISSASSSLVAYLPTAITPSVQINNVNWCSNSNVNHIALCSVKNDSTFLLRTLGGGILPDSRVSGNIFYTIS